MKSDNKSEDTDDLFFVDRSGGQDPKESVVPPSSTGKQKKGAPAEILVKSRTRKRKRGHKLSVVEDTAKSSVHSSLPNAEELDTDGDDDDNNELRAKLMNSAVDTKKKAAWVDSDDESGTVDIGRSARLKRLRRTRKERIIKTQVYNKRMRDHYKNVVSVGSGHWAMLPSEKKRLKQIVERNRAKLAVHESDESDSDNDVAQKASTLLRSTGLGKSSANAQGLKGAKVRISRLPQANYDDPCQAVVRSVEFHPSGEVLLTASQDRSLRLFHVDDRKSTKIQGVHLRDLPIHDAKFIHDGLQVLCTGPRHYFYTFDLNTGSCVSSHLNFREASIGMKRPLPYDHFEISKSEQTLAFWRNKGNGTVLLVDPRSKLQTGVLQNRATLGGVAFSGDSQKVYTTDREGMVRIWDIRMEACVSAHIEQGGIHGLCIASSPQGHYACGSDSGVASIYNESDPVVGGRRNPLKSIMNLTTKLKFIKFNNDGALMALGSSSVNNAIRLVHTEKWKVYDNFPRVKEHLRRINCLDFSRHCGYLALGNDTGRVFLYKIHAYENL